MKKTSLRRSLGGTCSPNCRGLEKEPTLNLPDQEWRPPPIGVDRNWGSPTGEQTFLAFDPVAGAHSSDPLPLLVGSRHAAASGVGRARNWPLGAPRVGRAAWACHCFCAFLSRSTAGGGRGRDERGEEGEIERDKWRETLRQKTGAGVGWDKLELPDRGRGVGGERGR